MSVDPTKSLMPSWLPRFNRLVTNRIQGLWAPYLPPWAMVVHRGRRSGARYSTPVLAFRRGDRLAIALLYGSEAQWVKNLLAAGGGEVIRAGRRSALRSPRIVTHDCSDPLPWVTARMARHMGVLVCELS
jgi:deazaflavin-dependent oxidoreductase (nitroreductase family)